MFVVSEGQPFGNSSNCSVNIIGFQAVCKLVRTHGTMDNHPGVLISEA